MDTYRALPEPLPPARCKGRLFAQPAHEVEKLFDEGLCYRCWVMTYCMALLTGAKKWPEAPSLAQVTEVWELANDAMLQSRAARRMKVNNY